MWKFLKKNWFVVLIVAVFAGISIYYVYDTNKDKLKGKRVDGKDVVYEINGEDTTADDFYEDLYLNNSTTSLVSLFKKAVADQSVKTTSEMKNNASTQAENIRSSYQQNYGSSYETKLRQDLESTGYTDLQEYLIETQKINSVTGEYAKANFDDLKIRRISYILVKFQDSSNVPDTPTADEQSRMDTVDQALNNGTDFAQVASDYSEDTSTASKGGDLGVIDKNSSSLDSTFLQTALSLQEGETSDWIKSDNFGYFKIQCTAATPETLEAISTDTDPYVSLIQSYDSTLENKAIWDKAQQLGVNFNGHDDIESTIKKSLGVDDTSDTANSSNN